MRRYTPEATESREIIRSLVETVGFHFKYLLKGVQKSLFETDIKLTNNLQKEVSFGTVAIQDPINYCAKRDFSNCFSKVSVTKIYKTSFLSVTAYF